MWSVCAQNGHIEHSHCALVLCAMFACRGCNFLLPTHPNTHLLERKLWHAHFNHLPFPAVAWHKYSRHATLHNYAQLWAVCGLVEGCEESGEGRQLNLLTCASNWLAVGQKCKPCATLIALYSTAKQDVEQGVRQGVGPAVGQGVGQGVGVAR